MKKGISRFLIVALLLTLIPANAFGADKAPFTLLVYLNGSDLESEGGAATDDLAEMMAIGSTDNMNVVVETGGTATWYQDGIANDKIQRWYLSQDVMYLDAELPNANMGDAQTLEDFIEWGVETYPADNYGLIMWNHGSGSVYGYGADENYDGDTLLLPELQSALSNAYTTTGAKFELFGFDTCLMSSIETASVIAPYADYMTASEELEPGHGWDYTAVLDYINTNPQASGANIGQVIVDSFESHSFDNETEDSITLSVTDLSKINNVEQALTNLSNRMSADLNGAYTAQILKARSQSESYGEEGEGEGSSDMVDLYDFASNLQTLYPSEANALKTAINEAVMYNKSGALCPKAAGLSAYFPLKDKSMFSEKSNIYNTVPFSNAYRTLVTQMSNTLLTDNTGVDFSGSVEQVQGESLGEVTGDYFEVNVNPDEIDNIMQTYFVLGQLLNEDNLEIKILGVMPNIEFDETNGVLRAYYVDGWETLGDQFVPMYLLQEDDTFAEYTIPAMLNNERVSIHVLYDENNEGTIMGARRVTEGTVPDRDFIKLQNGDSLKLIYSVESNSGSSEILGSAFTYQGQTQIGWTELPLGDYTYQFYIKDVYQNESYSDYVIVSYVEEVVEEEATVTEDLNDNMTVADTESVVIELPIGDTLVSLNSVSAHLDVPAQIINGRSMMPIRFVAENLGATVGWNGETKTVIIENESTKIELPVGKTTCTLNGETVELDVPAQIVDGRTLMPIRFIAENLGATVGWNGETKTVIIEK